MFPFDLPENTSKGGSFEAHNRGDQKGTLRRNMFVSILLEFIMQPY